jgi:hypothetical protein
VIHFLAFGLSRSADLYKVDGTLSFLSQFERIKEWAWLKPHLLTSFDVVQVNQSIKDILSVLIYFILFVIAGIYFQFFKKRRAYYSEHLVLFLHIISAAFLRNFVLLPVLMYNIVLGIAMLTFINLVYVVLALKRFYGLSHAHAVLIIFPTMLVVGSLMLFFWVVAAVITLWR